MSRFFTLSICLLSLASGLNEVAGELMPPPLARPQDQSRFHVTTFATGLAYPTSMTELADGSLLVATNAGGSSWLSNYIFASPSASLVRLVDADRDGVADGPAQPVATGLPGLVSSLRRVGDLVFALSSGTGEKGITILRTGSNAATPLTQVGRLGFTFPGSFSHTSYALATRPAANGSVEVFFNIGAQNNDASTPPSTTVGLAASGGVTLAGGTAAMAADTIYRVIVTDSGTSVAVSPPTLIARGLRNAAGMAFDPGGNLYLQDNGIDGVGHDSLSADELNRIAAEDLGVTVPDFGFAETYVDYATGVTVGPTEGITLPLVAFRPIEGEKSEGAVEVALAPTSFPADFAGGVFVPFSGKFNLGGLQNDENPLVFVDTATNTSFHFISNQLLGHPNGVLTTSEALYLSDLNYRGAFGGTSSAGVPADQEGVIYRITYVPEPSAAAMVFIGVGSALTARRGRRRQLFIGQF
jgi:hypothetical protein